jgi:DNA repair protein RecO (recombination protein O)
MKLFARSDTHADVFELYALTLEALKQAQDPAPVLRVFEKRLLEALGYGLSLLREADGQVIEADRLYHYRLEQGAMRALDVADGPLVFSGASLLSLALEDMTEPSVRQDARRLLKAALDRVLDGQELKSREVLKALRRQK